MQYLPKTDYGNVTRIVIPSYQCICVIGSPGSFLLSACHLLLSDRFKMQLHEIRSERTQKQFYNVSLHTLYVICLFDRILVAHVT
jgi:hypothetical protein